MFLYGAVKRLQFLLNFYIWEFFTIMYNTETFIEYLQCRVNCEHLSFEKTIYVNRITPMTITCKIHGDFTKNVSYVKYPLNSEKIGICPRCTVIQRELDRNTTGEGYVYLFWVTSKEESFYKLGYTQYKPEKRLTEYNIPKDYTTELITYEHYGTPKKAVDRELALHKRFNGYKYIPRKKFYGYEECYDVNVLMVEQIMEEEI